MSRKKHESTFGIILAAIAILLLWLMNKGGLLHESVSAKIITPEGTITSSPEGYPMFDPSDPRTIEPSQFAASVAPLDNRGVAGHFPSDRVNCTCPIGWDKWVNARDNAIWCVPESGN